MDPATVLQVVEGIEQAINLGEKICTTWSQINGDKGLIVSLANYAPDMTMEIVYQSEDDDSDQHGKFFEQVPMAKVISGKCVLFKSVKSNWSAAGNTNGVVYRVTKKGGTTERFLHICWCVPYLGEPYYHVRWENTWKRGDMRKGFLTGMKSRNVGDSARYSVKGMQRSEIAFPENVEGKLLVTASYGSAPLKVVVHNAV